MTTIKPVRPNDEQLMPIEGEDSVIPEVEERAHEDGHDSQPEDEDQEEDAT